MRRYVANILAALLALAGVLLGLWWAPFAVGLVLGALNSRARVAIPAGAGIGLLAWAIPLAMLHVRYGLGTTSQSLAAIMGFAQHGEVPLILTLLVGALLGGTAAWLGGATRALMPRRAH